MKKLMEPLPSGKDGSGGSGKEVTNNLLGKSIPFKSCPVTIEEIIAEGGFSFIYLAKQKAGKKKAFAVKRMLVNPEEPQALISADLEIFVMTSLRHQNLLRAVDLLTATNVSIEHLILMPYYPLNLLGVLNNHLKAGTVFPEPELNRLASQILAGLAHLHSKGIIHRDVKVENVLIDDLWGPEIPTSYVLCDFGSCTRDVIDPAKIDFKALAKVGEELGRVTTLAYRAPEMIDLYGEVIGEKVDVWAVGILIYKAAFLTTPFGDSVLAIQSCNLTFPPTSNYSSRLNALISYLLTRSVSSRPSALDAVQLIESNGWEHLHNLIKTREALESELRVKPIATGPLIQETSITPRSRPRVGGGAGGKLGPPISPAHAAQAQAQQGQGQIVNLSAQIQTHRRNVSDSSVIQRQGEENPGGGVGGPVPNWNPFCVSPCGSPQVPNPEDDDPFKNVPFDVARFGGGIPRGKSASTEEPPKSNNPFLTASSSISVGVTNLSFED